MLSILCSLFALQAGAEQEPELNLYEWSAIAPIVISGKVIAVEGKYALFRAQRVFRGQIEPDMELRVNVRRANQSRSENSDLKAFRPQQNAEYAILLATKPPKRRRGKPTYEIVRGVRGARQLPLEGASAILDALEEFTRLQDLKSENAIWRRFAQLLDEESPLLIENALDQYIKFRRGELEILPSLLPLLHHPQPGLRQRAARLIGQIADSRRGAELPDAGTLRAELIGSARRDDSVPVRMAATEALAAFEDAGANLIFEEIARNDPAQEVRYVAERILYRLRQNPAGDQEMDRLR